MKKIAFVFTNMVIGGAEKALVELLKRIDYTNYEVTIYTLKETDIMHYYLDQFEGKLIIKYISNDPKAVFRKHFKYFKFFSLVKDVYYRLMIRLPQKYYKKYKYSVKCFAENKEVYDCVIAYKVMLEDIVYACYGIKAKKRIAWMHLGTDIEFKEDISFYKLLNRFDKIFCVSKDMKVLLHNYDSDLDNKLDIFYNFYDVDNIRKLSKEKIIWSDDKIILLTVARLAKEKNLICIPETAKLLSDSGYEIEWYIMGDGPQKQELQNEIEKYSLEKKVFLMGVRSNPYPYINNCTIYVQTSVLEGYCTTTMEAKILYKPVVTTNAPGMSEQFVNGRNGIIVDGFDAQSLYLGIKKLLDNPEIIVKIKENLQLEDCDNNREIEKIYKVI